MAGVVCANATASAAAATLGMSVALVTWPIWIAAIVARTVSCESPKSSALTTIRPATTTAASSDDSARLPRTQRKIADPLLVAEVLANTLVAQPGLAAQGGSCPPYEHHRRLRLADQAIGRPHEEIG